MTISNLENSDGDSREAIFSLKSLSWFQPAAHITHAAVCDNYIFAATTTSKLLKVNITNKSQASEIEINHITDDRVHNLFVDPKGWHIIISMQSGINFYTNRGMKKVRPMNKAKDLLFDSVLWNQFNESSYSTQEIIIGTNDGLIFETILSASDDQRLLSAPSSSVEQMWKQLIQLDNSVTSLAIVRYPPGSPAVPVGLPQLCVVLATTPGRMYQFVGRIQPDGTTSIFNSMALCARQNLLSAQSPSLSAAATNVLQQLEPGGFYSSIFATYEQNFSGSKCIEFPISYGYSDLKVYQSTTDEVPTRFAWMTASGIYCGHLEPTRLLDSQVVAASVQSETPFRSASLTSHTKLIAYPTVPGEVLSLPLGICLTGFHVVIAYTDRVKVVCLLNETCVYSGPTSTEVGGKTFATWRDSTSGRVYLLGNRGLCELVLDNENCNIWKIYLEQKEYEKARDFCKHPDQLEQVNYHEAEYYFSQGDFVKSAHLFAETSAPFEELALRFSQTSAFTSRVASAVDIVQGIALTEDFEEDDIPLDSQDDDQTSSCSSLEFLLPDFNFPLATERTPLKAFLRAKLNRLTRSSAVPSDTTGQVVIVSIWLVELLLGEIGILEDRCLSPDSPASVQIELRNTRKEFRDLISSNSMQSLLTSSKALIYQLLKLHGNSDDFVFVANLVGDYSRLIDHYMLNGAYLKALSVITDHPTYTTECYKYSLTLGVNEPAAFVDACILAGRQLDPLRLLPTVLLLPAGDAIRYLEFAVDQLNTLDQSLHHQLLALYAGEASDEGEAKLMDYLKQFTGLQVCEGLDANMAQFSLDTECTRLDHILSEQFGKAVGNFTAPLSAGLSLLGTPLPYDPGFALRICTESGYLRATVQILTSLGLHEQAVEEALSKEDVELAKSVARSEVLSNNMKRSLWLCIARHVITENSTAREAAQLLHESSFLRLEDVLPLFPDFVTIDQFKETICDALDAYNQQIDELKSEMRATLESTNEVHSQLKSLKHHHEVVPIHSRCSHCQQALLQRNFYVFPCGHFFHTDCLVFLVRSQLGPAEVSWLDEVYNTANHEGLQNSANSFNKLVAGDCALCGRAAIESVGKLLFADKMEYEKELNIWI